MILTPEDILTRLQDSKPLSIVRAGDGEGIVLNATSSFTAMDLCSKAVMYRQLGYYPSVEDIKAVRNNLIEAYSKADIIGIPAHKQATSSHWTGVKQILDVNVPQHSDVYCSMDIGYDFLTAGYFDTLLRNRPVINYVSCRDLEEGFKRAYNIKVANIYKIPPEAKFTSGYEGEPHYPFYFNKIQRWMDVVCKPGALLLVGAGVIGKIYCNWWRDRGGVAFDVGSVLDEWAGLATRGAGRGLDAVNEDLKYKL